MYQTERLDYVERLLLLSRDKKFGRDVIDDIRASQGLTLKKIAQSLSVTQTSLNNWVSDGVPVRSLIKVMRTYPNLKTWELYKV